MRLGTIWLALGTLAAPAADAPIEPVTVCEVLKDIGANEGKVLAVMGRYSFRRDGRSLNEESCSDKPAGGELTPPNAIRLTDDVKLGPRPPQVFELDAVAITHKLKQMKAHTALRTFRFGTADYDRWAVVFGRLEIDKGKAGGEHPAVAARLVYRGDGVVLFLHGD